ncbi:MAG: CDP-alcohol phosphatidyltransferase family protein [Deltaproteobacteria bacterium]|nr:CDP-alcohol phosphatidyltransferase family protein [Deltaproteobacteria bacterium]
MLQPAMTAGASIPAWLPNAISALRILLVPVWLGVALEAEGAADRTSRQLALVAILIALGLSDVLDGFIARRFELSSNLGATLDAVADKIAQVTTVTYLALRGGDPLTPLPVWLLLTLLLRDLLLLMGFLLIRLRRGHVAVQHDWHGKLSSLLLFALTLAATLSAPEDLVELASVAVVALVVPSTISYVHAGWKQLSSPSTP